MLFFSNALDIFKRPYSMGGGGWCYSLLLSLSRPIQPQVEWQGELYHMGPYHEPYIGKTAKSLRPCRCSTLYWSRFTSFVKSLQAKDSSKLCVILSYVILRVVPCYVMLWCFMLCYVYVMVCVALLCCVVSRRVVSGRVVLCCCVALYHIVFL